MKKKNKASEDSSSAEAGIRVLTVALFIILLAFFIVLNSIAVVDDRHRLEALGSLTGSFGILPGGLSPMKQDGQLITAPQPPMVNRETESWELVESSLPGAGRVFRRSTPTNEIVSIQDRLLFDEGSYRVRPASFGFLKALCNLINQGKYPVEIIGHTDSRPADEKSGLSNRELSSLRALEVLKFFVVLGNVAAERLTAYGRAEYDPVASNETRQTRARNNRVDIVLSRQASGSIRQILSQEPRPSALVVFKRFVFRIFD
ncbi:MAG: OmpA family protein [Deltaproteobacteria bacterium]|nr:OmpA family protein [Deltaproteobacteria bacterium]